VSFGIVFQSIWEWTLKQARDNGSSLETISHNYGTPIVGETADWFLNDVHNSALNAESVHQAFANAMTQEEILGGQHGGGAGMTCHMFPGGTGTSSRVVKGSGDVIYTVGVIVQSNYGHTYDMQVGGVPMGKLILKEKGTPWRKEKVAGKADDGSIVIYLMYFPPISPKSLLADVFLTCSTDAPMLPHQLIRLARHCAVGLAQVGGHGVGSNHSGDIILALSTANKPEERVMTPGVNGIGPVEVNEIEIIRNESINTMFKAASEVTEEAILNSMIAGREGRTGFDGATLDGFPVEFVKEMLAKYRVDV
jgi:D-aminopeptidase